MEDFVYICRAGENEELRYSIRSVLEAFPDARIWVVGGKPEWYEGNYIEVDQNKNKYTNALNNIVAICNSKQISQSFIFMNDDFFILKKFDTNITFNGGLLADKIKIYQEINSSSGYVRKLSYTHDMLVRKGIDSPFDYELHMPIKVDKDKLNKIINKYPSLLWRSMYGNLYNLGGIATKDVKVYSNEIYSSISNGKPENLIFLSTEDYSFHNIKNNLLTNRFPKPSNLEK